jgi:hypothetical protein
MVSVAEIVSRIARKVMPMPARNLFRPYWHRLVVTPPELAFRRARKRSEKKIG